MCGSAEERAKVKEVVVMEVVVMVCCWWCVVGYLSREVVGRFLVNECERVG